LLVGDQVFWEENTGDGELDQMGFSPAKTGQQRRESPLNKQTGGIEKRSKNGL
jgi:hypothetical protein